MAKRFRNHNPNQYVLLFFFLFPIIPWSWIMSCIGSSHYNISLKCKYAKILLTTKMVQHSKSMQKRRVETQFQTKKNRCWVFLRHCLAWFRMLSYFYWPAAEPLADARGTQGFRGTPVENHRSSSCRSSSNSSSNSSSSSMFKSLHMAEICTLTSASFIHSFIQSFIRSHIRSLICSIVQSICWPVSHVRLNVAEYLRCFFLHWLVGST